MKLEALRIDWDSSVPAYRQIAESIRAAARDGRIAVGERLPPTRNLAQRLGVTRNTVVAAYDTLAEEGWVRSRTGRGTFVVAAPGAAADPEPGGDGPTWFNAFSPTAEGATLGGLHAIYQLVLESDGISFVGSYPAWDLTPVESFAEALGEVLRRDGPRVLAYGPTAGEHVLRERIAAGMRERGAAASVEDILVTNGAQQALALIFRTFLERGDAVVLEEPTYTGALNVVQSIGARVVAVPLDDEGIRPDLLAIALERHRPRLLYVQPTFQNPTTRVMSEQRRGEVLELARRFRCPVVEDDWAGDLRLDGDDLPTLYAMDRGQHVIYLSTFSKKLMPGLRIGWVSGPAPVLERLVALKRLEDCGTSPLLQAALASFLDRDGLRRHLERILPVYRERRARMLAALERSFPVEARWTRPDGGLFVWVELPPGLDGNDLFVAAQQRGVRYSRGELFRHDRSGAASMRLTFSAVTPEQIDAGVEIIGGLIRERGSLRTEAERQAVTELLPIF